MWHQFAFLGGTGDLTSITTSGLVTWLQGGTGSYNPTTNIWEDVSGNNNSASVISGPLAISTEISNGWKFNPNSGSYVEWPAVMNNQPTTSYTYIVSGNFQIPVSGSGFTLPLFSKYNANAGWWDTQEVYNPTGGTNPKGRLNQKYDYGSTEGNNRINYVATGVKQVLTFIANPDLGQWQVYINQTTVGPFTGDVRNWTINSLSFRFGYNPESPLIFNKSVSDFLLYSRILTVEEIYNNVNYLLTYNPNNYQS